MHVTSKLNKIGFATLVLEVAYLAPMLTSKELRIIGNAISLTIHKNILSCNCENHR